MDRPDRMWYSENEGGEGDELMRPVDPAHRFLSATTRREKIMIRWTLIVDIIIMISTVAEATHSWLS